MRSIPASAGQPPDLSIFSPFPQVYPRECGAAESHHVSNNDPVGLSPRVRGSL